MNFISFFVEATGEYWWNSKKIPKLANFKSWKKTHVLQKCSIALSTFLFYISAQKHGVPIIWTNKRSKSFPIYQVGLRGFFERVTFRGYVMLFYLKNNLGMFYASNLLLGVDRIFHANIGSRVLLFWLCWLTTTSYGVPIIWTNKRSKSFPIYQVGLRGFFERVTFRGYVMLFYLKNNLGMFYASNLLLGVDRIFHANIGSRVLLFWLCWLTTTSYGVPIIWTNKRSKSFPIYQVGLRGFFERVTFRGYVMLFYLKNNLGMFYASNLLLGVDRIFHANIGSRVLLFWLCWLTTSSYGVPIIWTNKRSKSFPIYQVGLRGFFERVTFRGYVMLFYLKNNLGMFYASNLLLGVDRIFHANIGSRVLLFWLCWFDYFLWEIKVCSMWHFIIFQKGGYFCPVTFRYFEISFNNFVEIPCNGHDLGSLLGDFWINNLDFVFSIRFSIVVALLSWWSSLAGLIAKAV